MSTTPGVTLTGTIYDVVGNALPNAVVTLTLPSYGTAPITVTDTGLLASPSITAQAGDDGTFSIEFWGNYQLSPDGSFYTLSVTAPGASQATWEANYQFIAEGTYDLATLEPAFVSGSYATVNGSRVYFVGPPGKDGDIINPTGSANEVYATPNGSTGAARLRALVAADLPVATGSAFGAVKPDGTSIIISAGVISASATTPSGSANEFYATPNGSSGSASLRAIVAADLPLATTGAFGAVKPDGTSITVSGGVISAGASGAVLLAPSSDQTIAQTGGSSFNVNVGGTPVLQVGQASTAYYANLGVDGGFKTQVLGTVVNIGTLFNATSSVVNVAARGINIAAGLNLAGMTLSSSGNIQLTPGASGGVQGSIVLAGSTTKAIRSVSANTTINYTTDHTLLVNASGGARTITLPNALGGFVGVAGVEFVIKKTDSSTNAVTIDGGGANVDGASTFSLSGQNQMVTVQSDGTNWWIVGQSGITAPSTSFSDVTGSRALSTVYQNTSGGTMWVSGRCNTAGSSTGTITCNIGATSTPATPVWLNTYTATVSSGNAAFTFYLPNNWYYEVTDTGGVNTLDSWYEMVVA